MASLLGKHQIAVNVSSLADGDSLAAYLTSAAGALITSETIGGSEYAHSKGPESHLDGSAYAAGTDYLSSMGAVDESGNWQPLNIDAGGNLLVAASVSFTAEHDEDSASASGDSLVGVALVRQDTLASDTSDDGDYGFFKSTSLGELYTHDSSALAQLVSANATLSSIDTSANNIEASVASIDTTTQNMYTEQLDQGTTLDSILADTATIDSQTLSIQNTLLALSKAEDAVHSSGDQGIQALAVRKDTTGSNAANGDYTSFLTWSEGSLKTVDISNGAILQQQVAVTDTATLLPATPLANRRSLMVQNTGANKIWLGSATVTSSGATAGIEMPANSFMELEVGPAVSVYGIKVGATGSNVNLLEMA